MKILSQTSKDTFVVQLEDYDFLEGTVVSCAHDYLSIKKNISIRDGDGGYRKKEIMGHKCWGVPMRVDLHIPIRDMIDLILPYLNKHPYLKREHLTQRDYGENRAYLYQETDLELIETLPSEVDEEKVMTEKWVSRHYTRPSDGENKEFYHCEETLLQRRFSLTHFDGTEDTEEKKEYNIHIDELL